MPRAPDLKAAVVDLLTAMGYAMKRRGDAGRARAYMTAANAVARRPDFEEVARAGRYREIRGVGPSIERTLRAFVETGARPEWVGEGRPASVPKAG